MLDMAFIQYKHPFSTLSSAALSKDRRGASSKLKKLNQTPLRARSQWFCSAVTNTFEMGEKRSSNYGVENNCRLRTCGKSQNGVVATSLAPPTPTLDGQKRNSRWETSSLGKTPLFHSLPKKLPHDGDEDISIFPVRRGRMKRQTALHLDTQFLKVLLSNITGIHS